MLESEFWELLYYHIIYSMDTGVISILLIIVTIELIRIRRSLEEKTGEKKEKADHGKTHCKHQIKRHIQNE